MSSAMLRRTANTRSTRPTRGFRYTSREDYPTFCDRSMKRFMTQRELDQIQQCCCPGSYPAGMPSTIRVQQQPIIISRKNIVYTQKMKHEPSVVNTTRTVMIPKVMKIERVIRVPEVIWTEGYVKYPKIEYCKQNVTAYEVKQQPRSIMAPQEICTTYLCRPKPQYICIPPPESYCCYPMDGYGSNGGGLDPSCYPGCYGASPFGGIPGNCGPSFGGGGFGQECLPVPDCDPQADFGGQSGQPCLDGHPSALAMGRSYGGAQYAY